MKWINNMKRFWMALAIWGTTAGMGLAQLGSPGISGGPISGSDQQVQAIDLASKQGQKEVDLFTGSFGYSIPINCARLRVMAPSRIWP